MIAGYKQTKIGVVPEDWEVVKLKELLSKKIQNGYSPVCPEKPNGNWILSLGALTKDKFNSNKKKPAPLNDDKVKNFLLKEGDFLISRANTPDRVGFSGVFRGEVENCSYPDLMMRFRIDENIMSISFLEYYLKSSYVMKYLQLSASGSSSTMVKINKITVENIPIVFMKSKEQEGIAKILTTWDDAIAKQEELIKAKEQQKKGLMQKLLSGEVRFDGFDDELVELRLDEVADINPQNNNLPDAFIYIDLKSVKSGILLKETVIQQANAPSRAQRLLKRGDILYQTVRPYQKNNFFFQLNGSYVASTGYAQIRALESPRYLYQYLHSDEFVNKVLLRCTGIGYPSINSTDLAKIKIKLPSKEEQQKVAEVLTQSDKEIGLLKNEFMALKEQKCGLMQKLLTGKIRVRYE